MAPAYKLTYFDVEGIAEGLRFILHYGGIEFEDERISRDKWPELKPKTPFGTLPLLTHNGKVIGQSKAIARYLAKQVKLTGNNDWEDLEIDSVVDSISDWKDKVTAYRAEQNEEIKKKLKEESLKSTMFYFTKFNEMVGKNNGYLCLGRLTWADLIFAGYGTYLKDLNEFPNLKALREKVYAIPNIKKWIEKRPVMDAPPE